RDQPVENVFDIAHQAWLVLDGRERGGRTRHEEDHRAMPQAGGGHLRLNWPGEIDDVVVALRSASNAACGDHDTPAGDSEFDRLATSASALAESRHALRETGWGAAARPPPSTLNPRCEHARDAP